MEKIKHTFRSIPTKEIMENRSSLYKFIDMEDFSTPKIDYKLYKINNIEPINGLEITNLKEFKIT